MGLAIGKTIKVTHIDAFKYILDVKVVEIRSSLEFVGRIERIFSAGEVTGGDILTLIGQEKIFRNEDILNYPA